jgi:hypothetical protein
MSADTDKLSAIEAGKAAAIAAGVGEPSWADCVTDDEWQAFVVAYLSALAEDEEAVIIVGGIVADGVYFGMPQVDPDLVPEGLARDVARAIFRDLATRAQGESS